MAAKRSVQAGSSSQNSAFATGTWVCLPYDGPALAWEVAACKAPDGSYWALQAWQRGLPDLGVTATAAQSAWELRLSPAQNDSLTASSFFGILSLIIQFMKVINSAESRRSSTSNGDLVEPLPSR